MTFEERRVLSERLRGEGFHHYAFISYPHTDGAMRAFAQKFHRHFDELLRRNVEPLGPDPAMDRVFIDHHDIPPGTQWEAALSEALCRSVAMIALCVPMYANSSWCGREWRGMVELGATRLPPAFSPIYVVRLGELELPETINRIQQFRFPNRGLRWLDRSSDFDLCLQSALDYVCRASEVCTGRATGCNGHRLPERSAFEPASAPVPPNRSPEL